MPDHMMCVRNCRSHPSISLCFLQRLFHRTMVFKSVCQIMVCDKTVRRKLQCCFIECDGVYATALSVCEWGSLVSEAAQNPQLWIFRASRQRVCNRLPIGKIFLHIAAIPKVVELSRTNREPRALPITHFLQAGLRFLKSLQRFWKFLQTYISVAQTELGHSQGRVQAQSLVE